MDGWMIFVDVVPKRIPAWLTLAPPPDLSKRVPFPLPSSSLAFTLKRHNLFGCCSAMPSFDDYSQCYDCWIFLLGQSGLMPSIPIALQNLSIQLGIIVPILCTLSIFLPSLCASAHCAQFPFIDFHKNSIQIINCTKSDMDELWKIHKFLVEVGEKKGEILRNAIAREKIARANIEVKNRKRIKRENEREREGGKSTNVEGDFEEEGEEAFWERLKRLDKIGSRFEMGEGNGLPENSTYLRENGKKGGEDGADWAAGDVAEWRHRFEEAMAKRYAKSERIRFLFCRKMYGHYVERVRQIHRLSLELRTCKEKRLLRKFDLDKEERVLLDRNSGKPYLCYEDIFDAILKCHLGSELNEMRLLFSQLKEKYANITFECIFEYFKNFGYFGYAACNNSSINGPAYRQQSEQKVSPIRCERGRNSENSRKEKRHKSRRRCGWMCAPQTSSIRTSGTLLNPHPSILSSAGI